MLTLRPFAPSDYPLLASWFTSLPDVVQWGGSHVPYPITHAALDVMLREGQSQPPSRRCWMVCRGDTPVGHAQLAYDWRDGNARLGRVVIAPGERGQGLGRPMVTLLIDEAFRTPGIERLELNVYTFNERAIHLYKTLGFTFEGVRRSSTQAGDTRWDTGMMGLLRTEWQPAAAA